ncbi:MAG: PP2C family protein-serine/threonine phosphatase [Phycisphaerae bacterium]
MADLTDYLDAHFLDHMRRGFSQLAGRAICIWDSDREGPLVPGCEDARGELPCCRAPLPNYAVAVIVNDETAGYLTLGPDPVLQESIEPTDWAKSLLGLMADVIKGMCEREEELRFRIEELGTLYRLTAEFTSQRDLDALLNQVARTVVDVLGVKACSIRLLNPEKTELLVRAVANLSEEYLNKGPILLEESRIDQEVLETGKPVYIADESQDPRVLYPAEAQREGIVSALCAPMIYKGGREGVIRIYTDVRHEFDWFEVSLLQAIAAQAAAAVVNAHLYQEAIQLATVRRHLSMAAEVQRRMIPKKAPQVKGFDIGARYVPCYELGGDFFDFIQLPEDNWGVAICDVAGKGVRASLLMASVRASLRGHAVNIYEMSRVLDKVNRDLAADTLVSDFATMFYGVLNVHDGRLTYANAGHPPPLLVRKGKLCHLETGGWLLGVDPNAHYRHESFVFRPGDTLLMYTDGLADAMNFSDESFGRDRIETSLMEAIEMNCSAESIVKHIVWNMRKFAGLTQRTDDTTLVAIRALET